MLRYLKLEVTVAKKTKTPARKGARTPARTVMARPHVPFQPNMLVMNADMASSTITRMRQDHSVISETRYLNCLFSETNFEGSSFSGCGFDACVVENTSLRGAELRNCDVEGLVINGVNVGELLRQITGR
jgi:hypothetical protein